MQDLHPSMKRVFEATQKTPAEIASAIDVLPQNITNWSKRGLSKSAATKISEKFGLPLGWLLSGEESNTTTAFDSLQSKIDEIQGKIDGVEIANPIKLAPIINEVQAGQFTDIGDDCFDEYEPTHHKDGDYWLRVKGDSMTPDFQQGDLILVSKDRIAVTGNYVVALVAGEQKATFKKYRECFDDGEAYYELIALNDFYPTIDNRTKPFEVIGVVLEHKRVLV